MARDQTKSLFFIALLPPEAFQHRANEIKQYFAQTYNSQGALKSPPHITLQPTFDWSQDTLTILEQSLRSFGEIHTPIPITLRGFGTFAPKVIYINVLKSPELLSLQAELMAHLKVSLGIIHQNSQNRPFNPHLTVAFRDLTKHNFRLAWPEFEHRQLEYEFTASELTLLIHDGRQWNVYESFPLTASIRIRRM
ncbi:MAG: 2'-5' RNA ligase family protein [Symploca sp. SIO3E6]|nr:2'-5' RNA ligase family protein [Caldora sp. SIO3E6]